MSIQSTKSLPWLDVFSKISDIPKDYSGTVFVDDLSTVAQFITIEKGIIQSIKDQPAIRYVDGSKFWYNNGIPHRISGPAVEWNNGDKEWVQNNLWHRQDAPAKEYMLGEQEFWISGILKKTIFLSGTTEYYKEGRLERAEFPSGQIQWYNRSKKYHKEDGPAIIYPDGSKEWYHNGKLHRDNGPAIEYTTGLKEWYHYGAVHRDNDLPAVEHPNGLKEWWHYGKCHRDNDFPAIITAEGHQQWWKQGVKHRLSGPAIIYAGNNTKNEYWIEGTAYTYNEYIAYIERHAKKTKVN